MVNVRGRAESAHTVWTGHPHRPKPTHTHTHTHSEFFLRRLRNVNVQRATLDNAGHYPLEQPGIDQLHAAMAAFVADVVGDGTK
jgi:pimeloyl-ACP methyl ester carboxylesterase